MSGFGSGLITAMDHWHQGKLFVERSLAVEHDALHVIVGMISWIVIALVLRRSLASWQPLAWLFVLVTWNEAVDLWVERWPDTGKQYGEGAKDLILTVVLPALLMLVIRRRPGLFRAP